MLDNVDGLARGGVPSLVAELIRRSPDVTILATSRERLDLMAEQVVALDGLAVPDDDLDAADYERVQVLADRASRGTPEFDLWSDVGPIIDICKMTGGSPLGIELAAAQVGSRSCPEVAASLRRDVESLTSTRPDVVARQRGIAALFESSWALLEPDERSLLARLSIFRGTFALFAATRIAEGPPERMARLLTASLMARDENGRYRLHALVRHFDVCIVRVITVVSHFGVRKASAPARRRCVRTRFIVDTVAPVPT